MRKSYRQLLTGIGIGLAAGIGGTAAYAARAINTPPRRTFMDEYTFTPYETQIEAEALRFPSTDGLTLSGWWLPQPGTDRVIIACSGHWGAKHEQLGIGSGLWRAGYNVLLFDFRGRGESDLGLCSLAYHEVQDLLGAVRYVKQRMPEAHIGVVGYSMGAAVSILASAQEPQIEALVADSSFASMREVIQTALRRRRLPGGPVLGAADRLTKRWFGYGFDDVRPIDVVAKIAPRPILFIHATEDEVIPLHHLNQLYAKAGQPKEIWVVEGMNHCGAYFNDRTQYISRVAAFFERTIGAGAAQASTSPASRAAQ